MDLKISLLFLFMPIDNMNGDVDKPIFDLTLLMYIYP